MSAFQLAGNGKSDCQGRFNSGREASSYVALNLGRQGTCPRPTEKRKAGFPIPAQNDSHSRLKSGSSVEAAGSAAFPPPNRNSDIRPVF
jgi:hypothetical protein